MCEGRRHLRCATDAEDSRGDRHTGGLLQPTSESVASASAPAVSVCVHARRTAACRSRGRVLQWQAEHSGWGTPTDISLCADRDACRGRANGPRPPRASARETLGPWTHRQATHSDADAEANYNCCRSAHTPRRQLRLPKQQRSGTAATGSQGEYHIPVCRLYWIGLCTLDENRCVVRTVFLFLCARCVDPPFSVVSCSCAVCPSLLCVLPVSIAGDHLEPPPQRWSTKGSGCRTSAAEATLRRAAVPLPSRLQPARLLTLIRTKLAMCSSPLRCHDAWKRERHAQTRCERGTQSQWRRAHTEETGEGGPSDRNARTLATDSAGEEGHWRAVAAPGRSSRRVRFQKREWETAGRTHVKSIELRSFKRDSRSDL